MNQSTKFKTTNFDNQGCNRNLKPPEATLHKTTNLRKN